MTPHKVECFRNNGEPYGRYVLPEGFEHSFLMIGWSSPSYFINANTFPMPGAEIGKTYEREEVEVVWQYSEDGINYSNIEFRKGISKDEIEMYIDHLRYSRQIFRLAHQPVEKEPETPQSPISSRQYIEQVYGTSTFARSIECKDAESLMDMMDDFLDWAVKKQQEASQ